VSARSSGGGVWSPPDPVEIAAVSWRFATVSPYVVKGRLRVDLISFFSLKNRSGGGFSGCVCVVACSCRRDGTFPPPENRFRAEKPTGFEVTSAHLDGSIPLRKSHGDGVGGCRRTPAAFPAPLSVLTSGGDSDTGTGARIFDPPELCNEPRHWTSSGARFAFWRRERPMHRRLEERDCLELEGRRPPFVWGVSRRLEARGVSVYHDV
jgi:hypothetical protein